jgi:hypothetical protein
MAGRECGRTAVVFTRVSTLYLKVCKSTFESARFPEQRVPEPYMYSFYQNYTRMVANNLLFGLP